MKIGYPTWLGTDGLKLQVTSNKLNLMFNDEGVSWYVFAFDSGVIHETRILKDSGADQVDFETNFKALCNKPLPKSPQAFASKTLVNGKSLFKRFTGTSFTLTAGTNTCTWTQASFPWVKFLGIEVIGAELGDTCDLFVLDTATGTYSGYANHTLNQFAYNTNVAPGYYKHISEYDSDMYQDLQIKIVYNSVSAKTLYINFDMNEVK